ncbi:hypothetical protein ACFYYB_40335 [Streptomyces sp. NPDC002886]|uniref:hypothetical protein n=1 Tax=Streptomyces sp. NPDC002886 TaxID=3364667 RepID=UPI0036A15CA9
MSLRLPGDPEPDGAVATHTWSAVRIAAVVARALVTAWALHTTLRARRGAARGREITAGYPVS